VASSYKIANGALKGELPARLRAMRTDGKSLDQMVEAISELGFDVSRETVRRWCDEAGVPTNRVPA
jgi:intein-encoded DNA endonuclease-like protein